MVNILRLVMAGVNGLLFAVGLYIVIYQLRLKPARWRRLLKQLVVEVNKKELGLTEDDEPDEKERRELEEKQQQIDNLHKLLRNHYRETRSIVIIAFGGLMMAVSLFALANLLYMPFDSFM